MSGGSRDAVKVKIIETEYVYADPMNFKSVVQRLTGKDAQATKAEGSSASHPTVGTPGVALPSSMEFPFQEEFDRMLNQMPSMDERYPLNLPPNSLYLNLQEDQKW
ncbi:hypothetical protein NE237_002015 [Protea cynaroides]|uniref:VQ domain-containing protein n=1 Tax=Protea cynaroides TaxID=273540 RepID=A0A9Q0KUM1_9MAGN|nr:hypothetical protein NE237_002015 [Protea cynaroides]